MTFGMCHHAKRFDAFRRWWHIRTIAITSANGNLKIIKIELKSFFRETWPKLQLEYILLKLKLFGSIYGKQKRQENWNPNAVSLSSCFSAVFVFASKNMNIVCGLALAVFVGAFVFQYSAICIVAYFFFSPRLYLKLNGFGSPQSNHERQK